MTTRMFDLGDVLTITHDRFCSPRGLDGIYDILSFMTGESLFTHALPRASLACGPVLLARYPRLTAITFPDWPDPVTKEVVMAWLDAMKLEYGDEFAVSPLDEWHHIDPLQELKELTERPDRIIAVEVP